MAILYRGFSTYNRQKSFRLTDLELVKQDLINHFNTRKGERVMYPSYGTTVWDMLFDPFDESTRSEIQNEIKRVVKSDPRVIINNMSVVEYDHGIQVSMNITLRNTNETETMRLQFEREGKV